MNQSRPNLFCCCCTLRTGSLVIGMVGWMSTLFQIFYPMIPLEVKTKKFITTKGFIVSEIAYNAVTLLTCCLMIYGVYKDNKRYILPWLLLKCMECIGWVIICFIVFVLLFSVGAQLKIIILFFFIVLITILNWYFWICVWCLYMLLRDASKSRKYWNFPDPVMV